MLTKKTTTKNLQTIQPCLLNFFYIFFYIYFLGKMRLILLVLEHADMLLYVEIFLISKITYILWQIVCIL